MRQLSWVTKIQYSQQALFVIAIAFFLPLSVVHSKSEVPSKKSAKLQKKIIIRPVRQFKFTKNGKNYVITKQRNEQGRLIKQSIIGPNSTEVIEDLESRGVFDYWLVEQGPMKMTATHPLLGIYRNIEVEKIIPNKGTEKVRFAFSTKNQKYVIIAKSFEKAEVLNNEVATVFAGGAIVDDLSKPCGMKNQNYPNELWDFLVSLSNASDFERKKEFVRELGYSTFVAKSCDEKTRKKIIESMADIALTSDENMVRVDKPKQFLACLSNLRLAANASNIAAVLTSSCCKKNPAISCNSEMRELGHYSKVAQPPHASIVINPLNGDIENTQEQIRSTLFHELLHQSGIADETLTYGIMDCCSQPADKFDFNSKACQYSKDRVAAISEKQKTQLLLSTDVGGDSYFKYVDTVREVFAPTNDSENKISDAFNQRSETIFQEEYSKFKSAIGNPGTCSKETNPQKCTERATSNFVNNFQYRISKTCNEGTFQASQQASVNDHHSTNPETPCMKIEKAAGELVAQFTKLMSPEEFKAKCMNKTTVSFLDDTREQTPIEPHYRKSLNAINRLLSLIQSSHADEPFNFGSSKKLNMSLDQGGPVNEFEAKYNRPKEKILGGCQLASDCYGIKSDVVEAAEVAPISSTIAGESSILPDSNQGKIQNETSRDKLEIVSKGDQVPAKEAVAMTRETLQKSNEGSADPNTTFKTTTPTIQPLAQTTESSPSILAVPREIFVESRTVRNNPKNDSSANISAFETLDPKIVSQFPDPEERTSRIVSPIAQAFSGLVPTARAEVPAPKMAAAVLNPPSTKTVEPVAQDPVAKTTIRNASSAPANAVPHSGTSQRSVNSQPFTNPTNMATSNEKLNQQRGLASTEKVQEHPWTMKDIETLIANSTQEIFEQKMNHISTIRQLIELKIQWLKSDGTKIGSTQPLRIIFLDSAKKRYLMKSIGPGR